MGECTELAQSCTVQRSPWAQGSLNGRDARCGCLSKLKSEEPLFLFHVWFPPQLGDVVVNFALSGLSVVLWSEGVAAHVGHHRWHAQACTSKVISFPPYGKAMRQLDVACPFLAFEHGSFDMEAWPDTSKFMVAKYLLFWTWRYPMYDGIPKRKYH